MTDPFDKAKASLGEAWRAARTAAGGVKKEIERAGIAKSLDDAGREIARAATSVANHLGAELEDLGREIRIKAEAHVPPEPAAPQGPTGPTEGPPPAASPPTQAAAPTGYPVGEAYAPAPGSASPAAAQVASPAAPPGAPPTEPPEPGGFRIAADDDRRS